MTGTSQERLNARRGSIGRATARLVSVVSNSDLLLLRCAFTFQCIDHVYPLLLRTDLSKKVATSWHNADDEVKLFCNEVSGILMQEYKKALDRKRKDGINNGKEELSPQSHGTKENSDKKQKSLCNTLPPSKVVVASSTSIAAEEVGINQIISSTTPATVTPAPSTSTATSVLDTLVEITSWSSLLLPSHHYNHCSTRQVDIDDDVIRDMWMACD